MSLLDKVSLVMTPNAVKATKVYSVIPSNGNGDMTFSRATPASATRTNSSGVIETVAIDVPRLNYDTVGGCPSLLLEPQRTNLALQSEDFSAVNWTKGNSTVSVNSINSPNGTLTADKIIASTSSATHTLYSLSTLISTVVTLSFYIKQGGYSIARFANLDTGGSNCYFDLSNGTIGTYSAGVTPFIQNVGNGWYRCSISFTTTAINANYGFYIAQSVGTLVFAGDGVSGVYIWGAQLEQGAYPTTYIPTTSGTVTRVADIMTVSPPVGTVKITTTFSDDTTQITTTIPSTYTAPIGKIKLILMQHTL